MVSNITHIVTEKEQKLNAYLVAVFDKSERCNNEVKFREGDWVVVSNLIKAEHLIFCRKGPVTGTSEIFLELAVEGLLLRAK